MVSWSIDPDRAALLLLDPSDVFVAGLLAPANGNRTARRLNALAELCRTRDIPVITTSRIVCPDGGLRIEPGDIRLPEPRVGAFNGTDLNRVMCAFGLDTVIIGGFGMKACYEAVARSAAVRGHRVVFLADGAAGCMALPDGSGWGGLSPAWAGHVTLSPLTMPFAEVTTCVDFACRLGVLPRITRVCAGGFPPEAQTDISSRDSGGAPVAARENRPCKSGRPILSGDERRGGGPRRMDR